MGNRLGKTGRLAGGFCTEGLLMGRLVGTAWMSLDGVVQAPTSQGEDPSGGFSHGGWHLPYFDAESMQWVVETVNSGTAYLLGRGTYEIFAAHWPHATK